MKNLKAEIFSVGKWNGITVTQKMIEELANNFSRLKDVLDVPLKLGHNKEQPMKGDDGHMSLGWIDSVWVEGSTLFANFTKMPEVVFNAIDKEFFKNVSIEAKFNVAQGDVQYGTVLTAVALLGVDLPAVNTLSDLKTYMTAKNLAFSSQMTFSKKPTINNNSEGSTMDSKEQAEFDALTAKVNAQQKLIDGHAVTTAKFTTQAATDKATIESMEATQEAVAFTAETAKLTENLEVLVKQGKATPAQRDDLLKEFTVDTKTQVLFAVKMLNGGVEVKPGEKFTSQDKDKNDKQNEGKTPSERVDFEVNKLQAANSELDYSSATSLVFSANPELATEFLNENDQE